jgi:hypothetical protein
MDDLVARYEILACSIHLLDEDLWFVRRDGPLDDRVTGETLPGPDAVLAAFEREIGKVLDPLGLLWRVHVAHDPNAWVTHVFFTSHHAITDAHAMQRVLAELLAIFDGGTAPASRPECLTPGADAFAVAAPSPMPLPDLADPLPFQAAAPLARRQTGIQIADLDDAASQRLTAVARNRGLSTNSVLTGLFVQAFCHVVGRDDISVFTAVSLRERSISGRVIGDLGCYIRVVAIRLAVGDDVLETASQYGNTLKRRLRDDASDIRPHPSLRMPIAAAAASQSFAGIGVTNIGIVDALCQATSRQVLGYRPAVNRVGANLGLTLHISRLHNRFSLTLTYPRPLMTDHTVMQTTVFMKQRLSEL